MTSPLPRERSTPELRRQFNLHKSGPGRTRTYEGLRQRIYSPPPLPLGTQTHIYNLVMSLEMILHEERETAILFRTHTTIAIPKLQHFLMFKS